MKRLSEIITKKPSNPISFVRYENDFHYWEITLNDEVFLLQKQNIKNKNHKVKIFWLRKNGTRVKFFYWKDIEFHNLLEVNKNTITKERHSAVVVNLRNGTTENISLEVYNFMDLNNVNKEQQNMLLVMSLVANSWVKMTDFFTYEEIINKIINGEKIIFSDAKTFNHLKSVYN